MDPHNVWKGVLAEFELSISTVNFETWIKPLLLKSLGDSVEGRQVITIACPSGFHQQIIEQRYYGQIQKSINKITGKSTEIALTIENIPAATVKDDAPLFNQPSTQKTYKKPLPVNSLLNNRLTFDTFVVGSSNNFAHAAAQGVIKSPGKKYNPLFIYGGVGLGKTHLMHAIGHELLKNNPELNILYISAETFTSELIASLQSKKTVSFKKRYRSCDVLLIDDIQFISGKEFTQEEFFHTFNELYMSERQIILTSDRPPQEIPKIEERLSSRFMGGLTVDIQQPDFEMRVAILKQKMGDGEMEIPMEALELIAEKSQSNARELEGTFRRISALAEARNEEVGVDLVKEFFGVEKERKSRKVRPLSILAKTAKYYDFKSSELKGKSRKAPVAMARHIAMYIIKTELDSPYERIGDLFGGRDHTSIMHGVEKIGTVVRSNPQVRKEIGEIKHIVFS